jgi:hypothetical protein
MTVTNHAPSMGVATTAVAARSSVKLLLIGEEADVLETIKNLHRRGFSDVSHWSIPMACENAGDTMSKMLPNRYSGQAVSVLTKSMAHQLG